MAKVAGYVKNIRVDIGDHVREGDLLATLEVPELQDEKTKATAGLAAAEANIITARGAVKAGGGECGYCPSFISTNTGCGDKAAWAGSEAGGGCRSGPRSGGGGAVGWRAVGVTKRRAAEGTGELGAVACRRNAAVCNDTGSFRRRYYEAVCEYGLDDPGGYFVTDTGDASRAACGK